MVIIRDANIHDAERIVDVGLKTWRTTYTGIINDSYILKRETEKEERINKLKQNIEKGEFNDKKLFYCVAENNETIIGFVIYGKFIEEEIYSLKNAGEIHAIYVLKEYQNVGIGTKLLNSAVINLINEHYEKVVIWALRDNPYVSFYRKIGGEGKLIKTVKMGEQELEEIGFVFDDINKLLKNTLT